MSQPDEDTRAVIAIVKGGLGNQLFIYAAARSLALRTGRELFLDQVRGFDRDGFGRSYRLDRFPIQAKPMPEAWRVAPSLKHPRHKLTRAISKLVPRNQRCYLAERHHLDAGQLTTLDPRAPRVTLLGYWQDERYFEEHAGVIRAELAPPAPQDERNRALGDELAAGESVFLHVRRVRYTPLLDATYYQAAVDAAVSRLDAPVFRLFGDDLEWARGSLDFRGAPVTAVDHNADDELADLWLMTRCRHAIVANSSFSWWGAWLAGTSGRVWCPRDSGLALRFPASWQAI